MTVVNYPVFTAAGQKTSFYQTFKNVLLSLTLIFLQPNNGPQEVICTKSKSGNIYFVAS